MKAGMVLTSINMPECLETYRRNFEQYGHLSDVEVFMIPDSKTPRDVSDYCGNLRHLGFNVHCVPLHEQDEFVDHLGLRIDMFPRNTDHRRNIGYLMALAANVDFVISIDDDNYCLDVDYFAEHSRVADTANECVSVSGGWLNPCGWLDTEHEVYQRGFPYFARHSKRPNVISLKQGAFGIHVNEGLWLDAPDVDAMTWLVAPDKSTEFSKSFVVAKDTWAPINSQNTALRAAAIPAYYFAPMNPPLYDRFGDIFQGYFLQACMKHLGGYLRVGTPIVEHRRNDHNYLADVSKELPCIETLEEFLPWLTEECKLSGSDYCETYECLAEQIQEAFESSFLGKMVLDMKEWAKACRTLGVGKVAT
jgi:hypothetical protein